MTKSKCGKASTQILPKDEANYLFGADPGCQGLAGFQQAQNNPSKLSQSAYLQNFATKTFFYKCVNIGSFWL